MLHELRDYFTDSPIRILVASVVFLIASFSAWDIGKGNWISHSGVITGKFVDVDCDDEGDCDTTYYVEVQHTGGHDNVSVTFWDYWKYSSNTPVRITYREGGVVHIRWFKSIEQMPANSY